MVLGSDQLLVKLEDLRMPLLAQVQMQVQKLAVLVAEALVLPVALALAVACAPETAPSAVRPPTKDHGAPKDRAWLLWLAVALALAVALPLAVPLAVAEEVAVAVVVAVVLVQVWLPVLVPVLVQVWLPVPVPVLEVWLPVPAPVLVKVWLPVLVLVLMQVCLPLPVLLLVQVRLPVPALLLKPLLAAKLTLLEPGLVLASAPSVLMQPSQADTSMRGGQLQVRGHPAEPSPSPSAAPSPSHARPWPSSADSVRWREALAQQASSLRPSEDRRGRSGEGVISFDGELGPVCSSVGRPICWTP